MYVCFYDPKVCFYDSKGVSKKSYMSHSKKDVCVCVCESVYCMSPSVAKEEVNPWGVG